MNNLAKILDKTIFSQADLSRASFVNTTTINAVYNNAKNKVRANTKVKIVNGLNKLGGTAYSVEEIFPEE